MNTTVKLLALSLSIIVYSCNQGKSDYSSNSTISPEKKSASTNKSPKSKEQILTNRKIIKEGEIRFETSDAAVTNKVIVNALSDFQAYIAKDNIYDASSTIEYQVTIRVPSEKFESLVERISNNAVQIDSKTINATDVTEEFIDAEARIKTKKELENRYKEILVKANKVEEIIAIEKEIGILRSEIESIEGRLNYLKDKVSYSTLTLKYYEKSSQSVGFTSKMGQALKNGWKNLLLFLVALTNLWPFLLLGLAILVTIRRIRLKRKTDVK